MPVAAAGVLAVSVSGLTPLLLFGLSVVSAGIGTVFASTDRDRPLGSALGRLYPAVFGLCLALLVGGLVRYEALATEVSPTIPSSRIAHISGVVRSDVFVDSSGTYPITIAPRELATARGTRSRARSDSLSSLTVYAPLGFDLYRGSTVEAFDIRHTGSRAGEAVLASTRAPTVTGFASLPWEIRAAWHSRLNALRCRFRSRSGAFFAALFLGLAEERIDDLQYLIRRAGCIHLLALSGMHIAVLIGLVLALCTPVFGPRVARIVALPIVVGYVFLIGMPPALFRAAAMFSVSSLCRAFGRKVRTTDVICAALVLSALQQPATLRTLSFRLTYLAVTGIVVGAPACASWLRRVFPGRIATALGVSLAAYLSTAWLVSAAFGELYPFGIVAGLVLGPAVSLFLLVGTVLICVEVVRPFGTVSLAPVYDMLEVLTEAIASVSRLFAGLPMLRPAAWAVAGISCCLWIWILTTYGCGHEHLLPSRDRPDSRHSRSCAGKTIRPELPHQSGSRAHPRRNGDRRPS